MSAQDAIRILSTTHASEVTPEGVDADTYQDERDAAATALADAIYSRVYGHLDDKNHKATTAAEIRDWLEAGDVADDCTVRSLAAEWRQRDLDDPNYAGRPY